MEFNPKNKQAEALLEYIKGNPITIKKLAKDIGISYGTLLFIMKGYTRDIKTLTMGKIESFLRKQQQ